MTRSVAGRLPSVLAVGGASWNTIIRVDRFPDPAPGGIVASSWHQAVGSSGAGKALNLARMGVDVTLVAALGDDDDGDRVAASLSAAGVTLIRVRDPGGTARHVNLMDRDGRRMSLMMTSRTVPDPDVAAIEEAVMVADLVYLGVVDLARPLIPVLRRHDRPVWTDLHGYDGTDPSHDDLIEAAEVVLFSGERLQDPRPSMEGLRARGKRLIVCTLAERGAIALTADGRWIDVAAQPAHVVDTNGAGDAFATGLMVADSLGLPLPDALAVGARAAALSVGSEQLAAPELSLERVLPERPAMPTISP